MRAFFPGIFSSNHDNCDPETVSNPSGRDVFHQQDRTGPIRISGGVTRAAGNREPDPLDALMAIGRARKPLFTGRLTMYHTPEFERLGPRSATSPLNDMVTDAAFHPEAIRSAQPGLEPRELDQAVRWFAKPWRPDDVGLSFALVNLNPEKHPTRHSEPLYT